MCYQLRIKIKELTGEVKANKFEQQKMLKRAKRGRVSTVQLRRKQDYLSKLAAEMDIIEEQLGNKPLSKEWEEKFSIMGQVWREIQAINHERTKKPCSDELATQLRYDAADARDHLIKKVRPELRATNIAYGYIKGRTYVEMEGLHNLFAGKWDVQWHRVAAMVYSYGSKEAKENFPIWLDNIGIMMERAEVKKGQFTYKFYQVPKFVAKAAA